MKHLSAQTCARVRCSLPVSFGGCWSLCCFLRPIVARLIGVAAGSSLALLTAPWRSVLAFLSPTSWATSSRSCGRRGADPGSQVPGEPMQLSLVLGFFLHLWTSCSRCEGRHVTWDVSGSMACAIENAPGIGHLQKRALKRAYARAQRCGGAWYRNQWLTTPLMATAEPPSMKWKPMTRASQPKGRRLKVFNWNVRSLTMELWADVQAYIQCQGFDIVTLQSTGWSFESSWRAAGYNIIHSGDPGDPQGGVMILIAQTMGSSEDISYSSLLLGRIFHVRVKTPQVTLDVLSCYQHPWRPGQSQEDNLQARSNVWDTLHESLSALPFRNRLILAGDFNSSLVTEVGADHLEFKRLVKHHHLDSLLSSTPNVPTYYSPQGNTQIDYVFGRRCQLDAHARCGVVDLQCPLASWREALDHRPLVCQMPQAWRPWRRKPPPVIAQQKLRDHLWNMKCQAPETWQTLCTQLADNFGRLPTQPDSLSHIHDVTLAKANQSYIVVAWRTFGPNIRNCCAANRPHLVRSFGSGHSGLTSKEHAEPWGEPVSSERDIE